MVKKSKTDTFFEKIPPFLTWTLITFPFWGGFFFPQFTAYIVILLNVFFLYKSISFTFFFLHTLFHLTNSEKLNWLVKLEELDDIAAAKNNLILKLSDTKSLTYQQSKKSIEYQTTTSSFKRLPAILQKILFIFLKRKAVNFLQNELTKLVEISNKGINTHWKEIHHIVMIPHWKEPMAVLRDTLLNLRKVNYPTSKINIMLGAEARDEEGMKKSLQLQKEFAEYFEHIWINNHILAENEIIGKSSNMASSGKKAFQEICKLGWDPKNVIVTSCDADSLLPKDYFANLTYLYVTTKDYLYKYYNGAILFYANIWKLPAYARVKNSIGSLYNIAKLARSDKFVPFSTYSVSFWLVDQIGYWSPSVTPEDYHLFFKGVFFAPHKVSTIPIYQRILVDAAEGEGHLDTIRNTYYQERRWSWGISDDGWIIKQMLILFRKGKLTWIAFYKASHVLFDHVTGIGMIIVLVLGGNIPLLINKPFSATVLGVNLPGVSSFMISITIWFLLVVILIDTLMIKPEYPKKKRTILMKLIQAIEWIFFPITGYIFVALPGIEAHTRLLFGKYLDYYLTKKK
ncbi:MAG: hypothetical protein WCJ58_05195 [bacterium]